MRLLYLLAVYLDRPRSLPAVPSTLATRQNVINAVLAAFGGLAVLLITFGGFKYVLSRGDPEATAKARNTILYAIVGLVVSMLAYAIVTFAFNQVTA